MKRTGEQTHADHHSISLASGIFVFFAHENIKGPPKVRTPSRKGTETPFSGVDTDIYREKGGERTECFLTYESALCCLPFSGFFPLLTSSSPLPLQSLASSFAFSLFYTLLTQKSCPILRTYLIATTVPEAPALSQPHSHPVQVRQVFFFSVVFLGLFFRSSTGLTLSLRSASASSPFLSLTTQDTPTPPPHTRGCVLRTYARAVVV